MAELLHSSEELAHSMDWKIDAGTGKLLTGGTSDKNRHLEVHENWNRLSKIGWELVTVINCLPFDLELHTNYGYFRVRGCELKKGESYFAFQLDKPRMSMKDRGEGIMTPEIIMPVEIAMDLCQKYSEQGGVVWYSRGKTGVDLPSDEIAALVMKARQSMTEYMIAQYELGNDAWQRYNKQPRRISPNMRDAARFCKDMGIIQQLPEWVHVTKATSGTKACPHCGETVKSEARVCRFCMLRVDVDLDAQLGKGATRSAASAEEPASTAQEVPSSGSPQAAQVAPVIEGGEGEDDDLRILNDDNARRTDTTVTKPPKGKK